MLHEVTRYDQFFSPINECFDELSELSEKQSENQFDKIANAILNRNHSASVSRLPDLVIIGVCQHLPQPLDETTCNTKTSNVANGSPNPR